LSRNGENPEPTSTIRGADNVPCHLALPGSAMVIASPKESPPPLVNGLDRPKGKKAGAHSLAKHSR
jgi:hypothetical protein